MLLVVLLGCTLHAKSWARYVAQVTHLD